MKPLDDEWRDWLRQNRDRGCDRLELYRQALGAGFDAEAIALELGGFAKLGLEAPAKPALADPENTWAAWANPPLIAPSHQPRAWRLDTPLAQIYEIPDLLSLAECSAVISAIDEALVPSVVTFGPEDYRTSRTCHLAETHAELSRVLDERFARLLGVDTSLAEPLQGQRYDPGEYFKAHTDWFAPDTEEFVICTMPGGQRTWTVMVYLNLVPEGGQTFFNQIGRRFSPTPGLALCWNNLGVDGTPNPYTMHEALPVLAGRKYVITKWFRAESGRIPE
jgi:prolyl 4-hydroxylase